MIFQLPNVLSADLLRRLGDAFRDAPFSDGAGTAGGANVQRKRNEQMATTSPLFRELSAEIHKALLAHNEFNLIAQPKHLSQIHLSRYRAGMFYGDHADNPLMGQKSGRPWRSDISFTLFLSDPASYAGGELALNTDTRLETFKLPPGHMVVYSTYLLHRVNAVTSGERRAAVGWAQSFVRDPIQRQTLLDIAQTIGFLQNNTREGLDHPEAIRLHKAYANLMRMWSEV